MNNTTSYWSQRPVIDNSQAAGNDTGYFTQNFGGSTKTPIVFTASDIIKIELDIDPATVSDARRPFDSSASSNDAAQFGYKLYIKYE